MQKYPPIYLHIGFSKCASSWLQNVFINSDKIFYVEKTHYFSPQFCKGRSVTDNPKDYYEFFTDSENDKLLLESDEHIILPDYCRDLNTHGTILDNAKQVLLNIKESVPSAKIILVIRNHKSLIVSRYSQYVVSGGSLTFKEFYNRFLGIIDGTNYFQNYYYELVSYLFNLFGVENVLLILQEELSKDTDIQLNRLSNFLGVEIKTKSRSIFTQRKGLSIVGVNLLRKLNKLFVVEKESIYSPKKTKIPHWFYSKLLVRIIKIYDYYFFKKKKYKLINLIDSEVDSRLESLFLEDNERLSKLIKKPLKSYGYY